MQDCMVRALARTDCFEPGTNMKAWLTTILRNLFFDSLKLDKHATLTELTDDIGVSDADQITHIIFSDAEHALSQLSADQKHLVHLAVEGIGYRELADRFGVAIGTIRSRLSRIRQEIRSSVEGRFSGEHDSWLPAEAAATVSCPGSERSPEPSVRPMADAPTASWEAPMTRIAPTLQAGIGILNSQRHALPGRQAQ